MKKFDSLAWIVMDIPPVFAKEFLSELNKFLTQKQFSQEINDLVTPVRNLLLGQKDLLSFSVARYSGADPKLAFFCQWYYIFNTVVINPDDLFEENKRYFQKKVPLRLRGVPKLFKRVEQDIRLVFQPRQMLLLHEKSMELMLELIQEKPFLEKFLNAEFLDKLSSAEITTIKYLYQENLSLSSYLEAQGERGGYLKLGLPAILGIHNYFYGQKNQASSGNISWVLLDEALHGISALYETAVTKNFQVFIYSSRLNEKEEFTWLQLDSNKQLQEALSSSEAREIAKQQRDKIYNSTLNNLQNVQLPKKHKEMLLDLLVWTYKMG